MPALPVIADVYRVALNWTDSGQSAVNVMHILRSGATASVIAASVDANVTTAMWGTVVNGASVNHLVVTPLDGAGASYTLNTTGAKWTGSGGVADPCVQCAVMIKLSTTLRGRSNRGRLYLPFTSEAVSGGGVIAAGTQTTVQNAWNAFLTAMVAAGSQPVVASYLHATQHPVSAYTVELAMGTQRRRQSRLR